MPVFSIERIRVAAVAAAMGGLLAGCAGSTDSVATGSGYGSNLMFDTLSGVALISRKQEPIDYTPRTGLVMPADANTLPAPQQKRVVTNPAWPQDDSAPGEGALAGLSDEEKRRTIFQRITGAGGARAGNVSATPLNDRNRDIEIMDDFRKDMRRSRAAIDERRGRTLQTGGVPTRRYLTDPPVTYRAPATATTAEGEVIARQVVEPAPRKRGLRRLLPF